MKAELPKALIIICVVFKYALEMPNLLAFPLGFGIRTVSINATYLSKQVWNKTMNLNGTGDKVENIFLRQGMSICSNKQEVPKWFTSVT